MKGSFESIESTSLAPCRQCIQRILVPVDFSHLGEAAIYYSRELAVNLGAQLHLVHVLESIAHAREYATVLVDGVRARAQYRDHLLEIQYGLLADVHTEASVREGSPFQEIVAASQEQNCDLIIMSSHGRTGLMHVLLGSTSERVLRHSTRPVLVVPAAFADAKRLGLASS